MKAKITTLMLCIFNTMQIFAQHSDGFFKYDDFDRNGTSVDFYYMEELSFQGMNNVVDAPINDAFMLLISLGLIYVILKRKEIVR